MPAHKAQEKILKKEISYKKFVENILYAHKLENNNKNCLTNIFSR